MKQRFLAGLIFLLVFLGSFALLSNLSGETNRSVPSSSKSSNAQVSEKGDLANPSSTSNENQKDQISNDQGVLVTRVVDGDTVEIEGGQKVGYIGVDTPKKV